MRAKKGSEKYLILFILTAFLIMIKSKGARQSQHREVSQEDLLTVKCPILFNWKNAAPVFELKKGWRTECGNQFNIERKETKLEKFWNGVLFSRPNSIGYIPVIDHINLNFDFGKFRRYGTHSESALRYIFQSPSSNLTVKSLQKFMDCSLVVVTASFGAQDKLAPPLDSQPRDGVCYIAFIDAVTQSRSNISECVGSWNVVVLPTLIWSDPRMKTRVIRALLPFFFPSATYSLWVDSKLQLQEDPVALVKLHLTSKDAFLAVSENHVRTNIYEEGTKLVRMFQSSLSVNETYDKFRVRELKRCLDKYRLEGFHGDGLPDAGVLFRAHTREAIRFSLRWVQEILEYPFGRDQISFPYVVWKYGKGGVNLFNKCWYVNAAREIGHFERSGFSL